MKLMEGEATDASFFFDWVFARYGNARYMIAGRVNEGRPSAPRPHVAREATERPNGLPAQRRTGFLK